MSRKSIAVLSVSAQDDNLGDIEIREKLFECVASTGIEIFGYRGEASASYMEAFVHYKNCRWFSSSVALQAALFYRFIKGYKIHFFIAPGPAAFSSKLKAVFKGLTNLANMGLARVSGGVVHIVGRAYRGTGLTRSIEIVAIKLANSATVRDELSSQHVEGLAKVLPDLAFLGGTTFNQNRNYLSISVREEKDLSEISFEGLIKASRAAGLIPIFVTQVKRDNTWMKRMSDLYEVDIVEWTDSSHQDQRRRIDVIYTSSAVILSNRLHGLIMGTVAGAIPVPLISAGNTKLLPTLKVVFPEILGLAVESLPSLKKEIFASIESEWAKIDRRSLLESANQKLKQHFDYLYSSIKSA
jgi:hypothetical protein